MALADWIAQRLAARLVNEAGNAWYVHQDWDTPPTPQAVVQAGLAPTIEAAIAAIPLNKQWWGGSRNLNDLGHMLATFAATWPAVPPPLGGRPLVLALLRAANRPTVIQDGVPVQIDLGYDPMIDDWLARNLIR